RQAELSPSALAVLEEWDSWFHQISDRESRLREQIVEKLGIDPRETPFKLTVVEKIVVSYVMPDGTIIEPSKEWDGLQTFQDRKECIFIRRNLVEQDFVDNPKKLKELDELVTKQVGHLLKSLGVDVKQSQLKEFVDDTLERPGVVLSLLREEQQSHVF